MFQKFFSAPFYFPMAIIGFPPQLFMIHLGVSLIYQFWIHTELIDGFGPIYNSIFNVPKHHQVHHGKGILNLYSDQSSFCNIVATLLRII